MPFSTGDFVYGGLLPALVAAGLAVLLRRLPAGEITRRLSGLLPFVVGFHVGYWLLSLGKPVPVSHWEWLPWALLLSAVGALPTAIRPVWRLLRYGLVIAVVIASSWMLVPDWDHLEPSRATHAAILAVGVLIVAVLLEPLTRRLLAWRMPALLTVVLTSAAIILALAGSLRFAQVAGCGVAAMFGMTVAAFIGRSGHRAEGVALPYALLIASMMLTGRVNSFSDVPLISYVLPPLAPLGLWPAIAGPLAGVKGVRRWLICSLPVVICAMAVGVAALS